MVIQSFVDQGALPRNVVALVERPADAIIDETSGNSKSWTLAEVERFRDSVRHDRLYACWLPYEHYHFVPVRNRERRLVMKVSTAAKALGKHWRE